MRCGFRQQLANGAMLHSAAFCCICRFADPTRIANPNNMLTILLGQMICAENWAAYFARVDSSHGTARGRFKSGEPFWMNPLCGKSWIHLMGHSRFAPRDGAP
jgi:hypothetical protein